jgi:hypothetical protein
MGTNLDKNIDFSLCWDKEYSFLFFLSKLMSRLGIIKTSLPDYIIHLERGVRELY